MTINDEIIWTELQLVPDTVRQSGQMPLTGIISVGQPLIIDAVRYMEADPARVMDASIKLLKDTEAFTYLRLPVSIRSGEKLEIRFLSVDIKLKSSSDRAVCWSMEPVQVEDELKLTTKASLTGGLKLQGVEIGPSASTEREYIVYQPRVEAFGIGEPNPAWEFRPTKGRKLNGIQLLHMVVRRPGRIPATGEVIIKADIFERGVLWNYRARDREKGDVVMSFTLED